MDCIFCKIINGDIPALKIYEDDKVFAFMDINPISKGHLLVIPKTHAATVSDIDSSDFIAVMTIVHKIANYSGMDRWSI